MGEIEVRESENSYFINQPRLHVGNLYCLFLPKTCWNGSGWSNTNPKCESQQEKNM